jgi:hypothetical protein
MSLRSYQTIEVVLRAYLCRVNTIDEAKSKLGQYPPEKVGEWPLATPIDHFEKNNVNGELHSRLRAIRKDRNVIAHQSLVLQDDGIAQMLGVRPITLKRLTEIDCQATKAANSLIIEYKNPAQLDLRVG